MRVFGAVPVLVVLLLAGSQELQGEICIPPWATTRVPAYGGPGCNSGTPFHNDATPCAVGDAISFSYPLVGCERGVWRFFVDGAWVYQDRPDGTATASMAFSKPGHYAAEVLVNGGFQYGSFVVMFGVEVVHAFHFMGPYQIGETDGVAKFVVRRSKSPGPASIDYATVDGTAKAGLHYQAASGTLAFAANEWEKSVSVPLIDDAVFTDGSFGLRLFHATSGYRILNDAKSDTYTAPIEILDDEPVPVITVGFSAPEYSAGETDGKVAVTLLRSGDPMPFSVSVAYRYPRDGFSVRHSTLVAFAANEIKKTIDIALPPHQNCFRSTEYLFPLEVNKVPGPRLVLERAGTTQLRLRDHESRPELAIGDIEVPEGISRIRFHVRLSAPLCEALRFRVDLLDGTARNSKDFATMSDNAFVSRGSLEGEVEVYIFGDGIAEPDETFQLSISGFQGVLEPPIAVRTPATCTILDDDAPPPPPAASLLDGNPAVFGTDVRFGVVFASPVTGVDLTDFELVETNIGGSSLTSVTGADATWVVTVRLGTPSSQSNNATVGLRVLDDDTIIDEHENPLGGAGAGNGTFTPAAAYAVTAATAIPLLDPVMLVLLALALAAAALRGALAP